MRLSIRFLIVTNLLAFFIGNAVWQPSTANGDEVDFVERFALAKDRAKILKELVPGTEVYYYYHCLHFQNTEQFDKVDELVVKWVGKFGYTQRAREILNRQAVFTYGSDPEKSVAYLIKQLNLKLDHQRENLRGPNLASTLDPNYVSRETLTKRALQRYSNTQGFETSALTWLIEKNLEINDLRHLLQRIRVPDHPGLVDLIITELKDRYSKGFGSMTIHRQLTQDQLVELRKKYPRILNQQNYVNTVLSKIRPNPDVNFKMNREAQKAHLIELWDFVKLLDPVHNSLKANILYHRLVFDREAGIHDAERFMEYIKLPRNASYVDSDYLNLESNRRYRCNLAANFSANTLLPPIGSDVQLVGEYLQHFFQTAQDFKVYQAYIRDDFLKRHFAESKIINGLGDPEQWAGLISPATYQAIKDRVDLKFAYNNQMVYKPSDSVSLKLNIKNVPKLIVRVFEINTQNFYRDRQSEIDTDIELDGLLPNKEMVFEYGETPFISKERKFDFPSLDHRGIYVVDFIGNRKSCRALIRKGQFRFIENPTAAGHQLKIVNENNQPVKTATVWIQGNQFQPDEKGNILVPYSNQPKQVPVVISDGKSSSLDFLNHQSENYQLDAGIFIDRESLVAGQPAKVVIRAGLRVNKVLSVLELLENTRLTITSTDFDGTVSTKAVPNFKLVDGEDASFEFKVPERLAAIQVQITGQIKNLSRGKTETLTVAETFHVNTIEKTTKVEDLYFSGTQSGYVIDLLGKNGEIKPGRPVSLRLKHRDFVNPVQLTLQTNMRGRISLGRLAGIDTVQATGPESTVRDFQVPKNETTLHSVQSKVGESIQVPINCFDRNLTRHDASLFEVKAGQYIRDCFKFIKLDNGVLQIKGLVAGDYQLYLKNENRQVSLFVVDGKIFSDTVIGEYRETPISKHQALQISSIQTGEENIEIQVSGADPSTRVHVFATRFVPRFQPYRQLANGDWATQPQSMTFAKSLFANGRKIGDEYQYILDRKYAERFPGVMLRRPGLLLQPWAVRTTQTSTQTAAAGDRFAGLDGADRRSLLDRKSASKKGSSNLDESTMNFLPYGTSIAMNGRVKDGRVSIDNGLIPEGQQQLHVVAISDHSTAYRFLSFRESDFVPADRSFVFGLDPKQRFARKKAVSMIDEDKEYTLTDIKTGEYEIYDNLPAVYRLFTSLNGDANLAEFKFILDWRNKSMKEKKELYSKYACHELNFFVSQKDVQFFNEVVKPYLKNKKDKTFLDHYLLGNDLSPFLDSWRFSKLNIVERILLAQSVSDQKSPTSRHIQELYELSPTGREKFDLLFNFAIQTTALDFSDQDSLESLIEESVDSVRLIELQKLNVANGTIQLGQELQLSNQALSANGNGVVPTDKFGRGRRSGRAEADEKKLSADGKMSGEGKGLAFGVEFQGQGKSDVEKYYHFQQTERGVALKKARESTKQLFRQIEKTMEWAENNYYKLPIQKQNADLVQTNQFWLDLINHDPDQPFYSTHFSQASNNFTEMMFALAFLDLEWEKGKHQFVVDGQKLKITADQPMLLYHEQIRAAEDERKATSILVSQNFFKVGDRYRYEGPDRLDKFVTDEFVKRTAYGCQVVVTNPTSSKQKIDVLVQVPVGSLPLAGTIETRSVHIELEPYRTSSLEYFFYFPEAGNYNHYPVNVARREAVIAFAESVKFNVVNQPSKVDKTSWSYISQNGTPADVIEYLKNNNLQRIDLNRIAWRMQDLKFFTQVVELLRTFHLYHPTIWAYAFKHKTQTEMSDFLNHRDDFVGATGPFIRSELFTNDRVARGSYEFLEYDPLVNARVHQLGAKREILNDRFHAQYHRLLWILACKSEFSNDDLLSLTYYMLLQDRQSEAIQYFAKASAGSLQYDYMAAYLDMLNEKPQLARRIAQRYLSHPVKRWREAFTTLLGQLDEIDGKPGDWVNKSGDKGSTESQVANSATFDFAVDAKKIALTYSNLKRIRVNYYVMDVELLFSRNPFVQQFSGELTYILPRKSEWIDLPEGKNQFQWKLPEELNRSNVLIEVFGGDQTRSQAYYAHALTVQTIENYGQLRVNEQKTGKSLPRTYCKVYAQMKDGKTAFYKDGYTDLRGRFDYASLSTNTLDNVKKFSILVMNDDLGATVKEVLPPKR